MFVAECDRMASLLPQILGSSPPAVSGSCSLSLIKWQWTVVDYNLYDMNWQLEKICLPREWIMVPECTVPYWEVKMLSSWRNNVFICKISNWLKAPQQWCHICKYVSCTKYHILLWLIRKLCVSLMHQRKWGNLLQRSFSFREAREYANLFGVFILRRQKSDLMVINIYIYMYITQH